MIQKIAMTKYAFKGLGVSVVKMMTVMVVRVSVAVRMENAVAWELHADMIWIVKVRMLNVPRMGMMNVVELVLSATPMVTVLQTIIAKAIFVEGVGQAVILAGFARMMHVMIRIITSVAEQTMNVVELGQRAQLTTNVMIP